MILNNKSGITKLDVSKLNKLEYLAVVGDIKKLDLSKNKKLKVLAVTAKLKKLNILKNKKLEALELNTPNLKKIDISQKKGDKIYVIIIKSKISSFSCNVMFVISLWYYNGKKDRQINYIVC